MSDKEIALELTKLSVSIINQNMYNGTLIHEKSTEMSSTKEVLETFNMHYQNVKDQS